MSGREAARSPQMKSDFDLAIIGSGFSGSLLAMIARRLGHSVIMLERGRHPRFAIGESSTPLANLLLEELAHRYKLPRLLPLAKWGTWQKAYPEIACGLKRGFTFYHHQFGQRWQPVADRHNELLVAASPHDGISDTHWYRPDFDHFFVREAQAAGAEYLDSVELKEVHLSSAEIELRGHRQAQELIVRPRFVVDASGPRGFLHRAQALGEHPFQYLPQTQALYAHFSDVQRWDSLHHWPSAPPYPADDAALHHIFDGGWIWVLRFNNGITSAGVAATDSLANELRFADGAAAWEHLLERLPSVREQFRETRAVTPFIHAKRLPFCSARIVGENWALLPSAAGFIDPLLSTGFPLTLLGVARLAEIMENDWLSPKLSKRLASYAEVTARELGAAEQMVAALYSRMNDFALFRRLTLLYFAAASFSETARRLGQPQLTGGKFLLLDHPEFSPRTKACLQQAMKPLDDETRAGLFNQINTTIAPVDVAGLGNEARDSWFPVEAADLFRSTHKLGVDETAIEALLKRCGFCREH